MKIPAEIQRGTTRFRPPLFIHLVIITLLLALLWWWLGSRFAVLRFLVVPVALIFYAALWPKWSQDRRKTNPDPSDFVSVLFPEFGSTVAASMHLYLAIITVSMPLLLFGCLSYDLILGVSSKSLNASTQIAMYASAYGTTLLILWSLSYLLENSARKTPGWVALVHLSISGVIGASMFFSKFARDTTLSLKGALFLFQQSDYILTSNWTAELIVLTSLLHVWISVWFIAFGQYFEAEMKAKSAIDELVEATAQEDETQALLTRQSQATIGVIFGQEAARRRNNRQLPVVGNAASAVLHPQKATMRKKQSMR